EYTRLAVAGSTEFKGMKKLNATRANNVTSPKIARSQNTIRVNILIILHNTRGNRATASVPIREFSVHFKRNYQF
ncbi:MAG: hypothetical protein MUP16_04975, partial [Sedimentisphaerales bacterium]|nr:hypothetical protein [Sedimentisphaerales bacterium]